VEGTEAETIYYIYVTDDLDRLLGVLSLRELILADQSQRLDEIMKTQREISENVNKKYMGRNLRVLIDEVDSSARNQFLARSKMDAPEVDGLVYVRSERPLKPGDFVDVTITDTLEYDLVGNDDKQ